MRQPKTVVSVKSTRNRRNNQCEPGKEGGQEENVWNIRNSRIKERLGKDELKRGNLIKTITSSCNTWLWCFSCSVVSKGNKRRQWGNVCTIIISGDNMGTNHMTREVPKESKQRKERRKSKKRGPQTQAQWLAWKISIIDESFGAIVPRRRHKGRH